MTPSGAQFSGSGCYQIRVVGHLDSNWATRVGAMSIRFEIEEDSEEVTVLEGPVSDQAELAGVLNTLYELHLPLIAVNRVSEAPTTQGTNPC